MSGTTESPCDIRPYAARDWAGLGPLLQRIVQAGDSFAQLPGSSLDELHAAWVDAPAATCVALQPGSGRVLGAYYLKPNQPGLGSHVGNAGYAVANDAGARGIGEALYRHSEATAIAMGFRALQFNFVVSTNERAVRLWQRMGFHIVGRLPGAYRHARLGDVDALVMFKQLA